VKQRSVEAYMRRRLRLVTNGYPGPALNGILVLLVLAVVAIYRPVLLPWMTTWGASSDEARTVLPGDELVPHPTFQSTRAVSITESPERIWPWLVQMGQDRGGFYSYDWLENLVAADIHNADRIVPEWQHRVHGDFVPSLRPDYAGGRVRDIAGWRIGWIEANRGFALIGWGSFVLVPDGPNRTRLIVRTRTASQPGAFFNRFAELGFGRPLHFVMERRMMIGIKERVEGTASPAAVMWLATLGFLAAGVLASWYLMRKGDAIWLFLALAVIVSLIKDSNDVRAALVSFAAITVITHGLLRWRQWWAVDVTVAAFVLLTLLFAHDAYVTLGMLLLVASGGMVAAAAIPHGSKVAFQVVHESLHDKRREWSDGRGRGHGGGARTPDLRARRIRHHRPDRPGGVSGDARDAPDKNAVPPVVASRRSRVRTGDLPPS
jgi:hypothetical protein